MVDLGDFSRALTERWAGVLYQQGRVTTDADGTAQTLIALDWQDTAATDVIGPGVVAVPAADRDALAVGLAGFVDNGIVVEMQPGRAWVDGRLVRIDGDRPVRRRATWIGEPVQDARGALDSLDQGPRDALVLEVSREAVSAFQYPDELLEPALGGPDTTERLRTTARLRLFRLEPGMVCGAVADAVRDDRTAHGRLTVELEPQTVIGGDCPVVEGGGYSGFEHSLYRIEIARTDDPSVPMFKWSQFNGGLVGRAAFDAVSLRATITANLAAIAASGLDAFYLEALALDEAAGDWVEVYGARVQLDDEGRLDLPVTPIFGTIPDSSTATFIRLWNGIERVDSYLAVRGSTAWRDGIRLGFAAAAADRVYVPRDYWTFTVRAGDIPNDGPFPADAPPDGPVVARAPLAILDWSAGRRLAPRRGIEDCRTVFSPLTRLDGCCVHRVGDGVTSHGEFESIQEAIDALPPDGGEVCVLPGTFRENVQIVMRRNVTISGCTGRSIVTGAPSRRDEAPPVFHVVNSQGVRITGLAIQALADQAGVLAEDNVLEVLDRGRDVTPTGATRGLTITDLLVSASTRPAIAVHGATDVTIRDNLVSMADVRTSWPGIFLQGDDAVVEGNVVRTQRRVRLDTLRVGGLARLFAPHVETMARHVEASTAPSPVLIVGGGGVASQPGGLAPAAAGRLDALVATAGTSARLGVGGIQVGGLSSRVRLVRNVVQSGAGNGITLGSVRLVNRRGIDLRRRIGWIVDLDLEDDGNPCLPGRVVVTDPPPNADPETPVPVPAGALRDIAIEGNRIVDAGLNGIGVVGFFAPGVLGRRRVITIEGLRIKDNEIRRCLARPLTLPDGDIVAGFGGISLADTIGLSIRDNTVEDNGGDALDPVCGVFVLHGEGIEIAGNRIVNNGAAGTASPANARSGRRGGIHVVTCSSPINEPSFLFQLAPVPGQQDGTPAIVVRDNIVSQPLGQALTVSANGPVVVQGNSLTSLGIVPVPESLQKGLFGATVAIFNMGRSAEAASTVRSFIRPDILAAITVAAIPDRIVVAPGVRPAGVESTALAPGFVHFADNYVAFAGSVLRASRYAGTISPGHAAILGRLRDALGVLTTAAGGTAAGPAGGAPTPVAPAEGIGGLAPSIVSARSFLTASLPSGTFTERASGNERATLGSAALDAYSSTRKDYPVAEPSDLPLADSLIKTKFTPASLFDRLIRPPKFDLGLLPTIDLTPRLTSVSIWSLDDVAVQDNQCLTTMADGRLLSHLFAYGDSLRVTGNRLKEAPGDAVFSAITLGGTNITAHNQATHCLVVRPAAAPGSDRVINGPNIVVVTGAERAFCASFEQRFGDFGRLGG